MSSVRVFFYVQWDNWQAIVFFVDIGGFSDHQCLNFLFIIVIVVTLGSARKKRHNNSLLHKQRQLIGFTLQIYYTTLYNYNHYITNILYNMIQL
jgi:hypothetical protein